MLSIATYVSLALLAGGAARAQGDPEALAGPASGNPTKSWSQWTPKPTYALNDLPDQYMGANRAGPNSEDQSGWNNCTENTWNQQSHCQTAWLNSLEDWCLWGPPEVGDVGSTERVAVAYCTTDAHGTRLIPDGAITGAHFVKTRDYVQITGVGDMTQINIIAGDTGGEMDPHGADDLGNPIGGVVYTTANPASNGRPFFVSEWTNFMSADMFCLRACWGQQAAAQCEHIYDVLGCRWNLPANYEAGTFESCDGEIAELQGIYSGSTFRQGDPVTPDAHPAPSSSDCTTKPTLSHGLLAGAGAAVTSSSSSSSSISESSSSTSSGPSSSSSSLPTSTAASTSAAPSSSSASGSSSGSSSPTPSSRAPGAASGSETLAASENAATSIGVAPALAVGAVTVVAGLFLGASQLALSSK